jgi:hypothetical protein
MLLIGRSIQIKGRRQIIGVATQHAFFSLPKFSTVKAASPKQSQVNLLITNEAFYVVQRAREQSKTGIFRDYGVAEAPQKKSEVKAGEAVKFKRHAQSPAHSNQSTALSPAMQSPSAKSQVTQLAEMSRLFNK